MKENLDKSLAVLSPNPGERSVLRTTLTGLEPSGLRWAMEVAATHGYSTEELERMLESDIGQSAAAAMPSGTPRPASPSTFATGLPGRLRPERR